MPSVVDRSALPVTFMVPRLSPSELCSVEFSALLLCDAEFCAMPLVAELTTALPYGAEFTAVGLPGFCAELCDAALLEDKFEIGDVELRDVAAVRELCDDEILEAELAADEF
ncbi:hypothetical protein [uncultured Campylobacter sp.]|uniref:hypothetical protein n=1 Tax=uncultured Campylobacter sp. TaxID=218934 RepID=UPI00260FCE64|nr:hypothetical protein [uncultured Campylobacter sp.]